MTGLITIGETLALLTSPRVAPLQHQSQLDLSIGGAESNTAIAVARLGGRATWMGRLSTDGLGELILTTLRGEGVDVIAVADPGSTSVMIKDRRSAMSTRVHYYRSTGPGSRLRPEDIDEGAVRSAQILHLTGITPALSLSARAAVFAAIETARAAGVTVSFDVNHRSTLWSREEAVPVLADLSALADILFVGDDELELLGGDPHDDVGAAHQLADRGPREVVVKRGARGAAVLAGEGFYERPAVPVTVVDPVGAGDAFAGGYLAELLAGRGVQDRLRTGVACGAWAVTVVGDWEAAPRRSDLADLESEPGVRR